MRIRRTMFSLSPLLLMTFGPAGCGLETSGAGQFRASFSNGHLDFPKHGGFGKTFQDAAGESLKDSQKTVYEPSLPPLEQGSRRD